MATMAIGGQEMAEMQARQRASRGRSVAERNRELFDAAAGAAARTDAGGLLRQAHRQQPHCEGG